MNPAPPVITIFMRPSLVDLRREPNTDLGLLVEALLNATQVGIPNQGQPPLEVLSPETIRQRLLA